MQPAPEIGGCIVPRTHGEAAHPGCPVVVMVIFLTPAIDETPGFLDLRNQRSVYDLLRNKIRPIVPLYIPRSATLCKEIL